MAVWCAGVGILAAAERPAFGAPGAASPEDVLAEFQAVCDDIVASDEQYYGRGRVAELQRVVGAGILPPRQDVIARTLLARERLRLGDEAEAVRLLESARRRAASEQLDEVVRVKLLFELGLAHLRLGEVANCVGRHTPQMCLFPIRPGGRHVETAGSRAALAAFTEYLESRPDDALARWLATVAAMTLGPVDATLPEPLRPDTDRLRSAVQIARFRDVAHEAGLRLHENAGAALVDDFDGDGDLDVITSSVDPCSPMRLFRNRGDGRFDDDSQAAGLDVQLGGINATHADYDGDGDLDVLVLRGGWMGEWGRMRNSLLRNDGDGRFTDVTAAAGLAEPAMPTQTAAWADYDRDGDLDLYVGNEDLPSRPGSFPSQLFRNDGGTFTDVARAAGVANQRYAKGVAWGDYDDDGNPDIYVSNLGPNRLYRNDADGTFTDVAPELGVTEPAGRSFPTWFFDFDNDGDLDIFVADYGAEPEEVAAFLVAGTPSPRHPLLYRNDGGSFREVSEALGLVQPSLPMGANFGDADGDGFLDIYLGTGDPLYESLAPNLLLWNDAGARFVEAGYDAGVAHLQKGHGVAFADFDDDGDQDLFEQMGGVYPGDPYHSVLYENEGEGDSFLRLSLEAAGANRFALGARVTVKAAGPAGRRSVHRVLGPGGSFGESPFRIEVGLGDATEIEEVEIVWPASGERRVVTGLKLGRWYRVREGREGVEEIPLRPVSLGGETPHAATAR